MLFGDLPLFDAFETNQPYNPGFVKIDERTARCIKTTKDFQFGQHYCFLDTEEVSHRPNFHPIVPEKTSYLAHQTHQKLIDDLEHAARVLVRRNLRAKQPLGPI